ncbi:copper resistance protein B [Sphingomonas sp. GM_Shp_1]|uniref:copper resistance protein B n=1 Tax=Sphingomonas sp. GM_Shp_1 TaxID=2937381 RepID=UPI00226B2DE5|nr:copper resistance protein B [Sphingomonas sp. GM_Shp_1]
MILLALLLAQPQHHDMAMPGTTMPMAKPKPKPKPAQAAKRKAAKRPASGPLPSAPSGACSPEHAAMGHCQMTPPPAPQADDTKAHDAMPGMASMPEASAAQACPPEHAAMGHCRAETPSQAQDAMGNDAMPGMASMPEASAPQACPPEHAAMGHCQPTAGGGMAMDHAAMPGMSNGQEPVGAAPPPPPPSDRAADRFYDPAAMAVADRRMRMEHGGMRFLQILFNLAEVQIRDGRESYRWDGEGWFGGDIDRLVIKSEGEGGLGDRIGAAEVQALYARAIDPYWNLQAGLRQDVGAGARRTYAVLGIEGLAPYWFDVEGALFLSDKGEVLARAEAWIDQRITQRAILQPRVEMNFAAQDVPEQGIASGVSNLELGLRLRYEIAREFAPYVGVSWERRYGPASGGGAALALGIRTWF